MRFVSLLGRGGWILLLGGLVSVCLSTLFTSCEGEVDPYLASDELARLSAYQQVHYPAATRMGNGVFYHVAKANSGGGAVEEGHWMVFDFSVYDLNGMLINTTSWRVARDNSMTGDRALLRPRVQRNIAPEWGSTLCEVLSRLHVGDSAVIGVPYAIGSQLRQWSQPKHQSVVLHITMLRSAESEKVYEDERIRSYLGSHEGFQARDTIYRRVISEGDGEPIQDDSSLVLRYAGYFLDGILFDTNIQGVAIDRGVYVEGKTYEPLVAQAKDDRKVIRGFSNAFEGLKAGCRVQLLVPSQVGYRGARQGAIQPYEPLLFDVQVVGISK